MFGRLTWGEAEGKLGAFASDESAEDCRCTLYSSWGSILTLSMVTPVEPACM